MSIEDDNRIYHEKMTALGIETERDANGHYKVPMIPDPLPPPLSVQEAKVKDKDLSRSDHPRVKSTAAPRDDDRDDSDDYYDGDDCQRCGGEGVILVCIDDMCRGAGECFHGDGYAACPDCARKTK